MDRRKVLLLVAAVIALLGTLLVFVYVKGADNRADQRYGAVQVLRVTKPIAAGETIEAAQAAGKIETGTVTREDLLPGALTDLSTVAGKVAVTPILAGEQVVAERFGAVGSGTDLSIPKGKIAISLNLDDPSRVAGFLNPGNRVAVFMTGTDAKSGGFTRLLLPNVTVIGQGTTTTVAAAPAATGGTADPAAAPAEALPKALLTLAVSQSEAERLMYASRNGSLAFGLLNDDSQVGPSTGVTADNLFR